MEKFLEKFQADIENKMLSCARGESIVKPFAQIYDEVREKTSKKAKNATRKRGSIYAEGEASIYSEVVQKFLEEHPELVKGYQKQEEEK
jgi:hypothetical protein